VSAAFISGYGLNPCAAVGAWTLPQIRATVLRLWLPISLSVVLHLLALSSLHDLLAHGKSGQLETGRDDGLRVRLLDVRSNSGQTSPRQENAATPLSSNSLPGHSEELAQLTVNRPSEQASAQEKPVTAASPAHPQKLADGAAELSATASANVNGVVVKPQAADGGRGNFDAGYIPSTTVERAPSALVQPDLNGLAGVPRPHAPIHLRAYVEQSGSVHEVVVMSCDPADQATADLLAKIYRDVVYIPAYDHGKQVPSKIDFTITLSDASLPSDRPEGNIIRKTTP
jgi:hypothetical protein